LIHQKLLVEDMEIRKQERGSPMIAIVRMAVLVALLWPLAGRAQQPAAEPDRLWAEEAFVTARAVLEALEPDPEAARLFEALAKSLEDLDLKRIYRLLDGEQGERRVTLAGAREGAAYRLRRLSAFEPPPSSLGAFALELRLRPDPIEGVSGAGYALGWRAQLVLGPLSWQRLHALLDGGLRRLQAGALLEPWPRTQALLRELSELGGPAAAGPEGTLRLDAALRLDALGRRHPRLARFVRGLGELAQVRLALRARDAERLLGAEARTASPSAVLELRPAKLQALLGAGQRQQLVLQLELRLQHRGLRSQVGPVLVFLSWDARAERLRGTAALNLPPPVAIEGRVFSLVPTGLIDALIPGTLEGLARDFTGAMAAGGGWALAWEHGGAAGPGADGGFRLTAEGGGLLLDNGLIQMGLRAVSRRVRLGPHERTEARALLGAILDALEADWREAR
jgi:hypothetical protein